MLSEMRDTMGLLIKSDGADPAGFSDGQWQVAIDWSCAAPPGVKFAPSPETNTCKASPTETSPPASPGRVTWPANERQPRPPKFVVPEEGLQFWSDNMVVPNLATHKRNAEAWMNYFYDPRSLPRLRPGSGASVRSPVRRAAMEKIDPSLVDNPLIFLPTDFLVAHVGVHAAG